MEATKAFYHTFWNKKFAELGKFNQEFPDVEETQDNFINKLDEIAIEYNVTSFGFKEHEGVNSGVRATMEINLGIGKDYFLDIAADSKNGKIKKSYLELNIKMENEKIFLANTFVPQLPYFAISKLLGDFKELDRELDENFLVYNKKMKLSQMTVATIKSLLTEKLKNTGLEWKLNGNLEDFAIEIFKDQELIKRVFVTESDFINKILTLEI